MASAPAFPATPFPIIRYVGIFSSHENQGSNFFPFHPRVKRIPLPSILDLLGQLKRVDPGVRINSVDSALRGELRKEENTPQTSIHGVFYLIGFVFFSQTQKRAF
jgi:hypothetical protein